VVTALESRFWAKLRRLESWHSDNVKAQSFTNTTTTHGKPGSVELRVTPYPHLAYWTNEWRKAKHDEGREEVLSELDAEWHRLGHSASPLKWLLTPGTLEYKRAIANDDRPARVVAHAWKITERTVYRHRKEHREKGS
jgi:hypothetical protein